MNDPFARQKLITWWDQEKIENATIGVFGVGAIGNEFVHNAALLGFKKMVLFDLDKIELSNLSRTALFRKEDEGRKKPRSQLIEHVNCVSQMIRELIGFAETLCMKSVAVFSDALISFLVAWIMMQLGFILINSAQDLENLGSMREYPNCPLDFSCFIIKKQAHASIAASRMNRLLEL